jgi:hypothetical protein
MYLLPDMMMRFNKIQMFQNLLNKKGQQHNHAVARKNSKIR